MRLTEQDLQDLMGRGRIKGYKVVNTAQSKPAEPKRSKYNNKRVEWDGQQFDSLGELNRYKRLLLLLQAGQITDLRRQVQYELNEGGTHSLVYIADFVYTDQATGQQVVEDFKGHRTKEYIKKRRLMKKVHGITIFETGP